MRALERRIALMEASLARRNQRPVYGQKPLNVDWLGYPIGSEPTEPVECPPGSGVDWLGYPIAGKSPIWTPPTKNRSSR